jgi:cellobiose phosphorylase
MKNFTVTRHFRNALYRISFDNSAGVEKGVKSVMMDGKLLDTAVLPALGDGKVHDVTVIMG